MDSARSLMVPGGVGSERELGDLTLRCGKIGTMAFGERVLQPLDVAKIRGCSLGMGDEAKMRSADSRGKTQEDFDRFIAESNLLPLVGLDDDGELDHFDFDAFLSADWPETEDQAHIISQGVHKQENPQCAEASAQALPTELRTLALDRLRQIGGHFPSSSATKETRRRAELENEWLLWWDESPTGCFDDSKDYFVDEAQRTYTEAWEKHIREPGPVHVHRPYLDGTPIPRLAAAPSVVQPMPQPRTIGLPEARTSTCPNRRSHEDLTACGRSTPIAAQHRPCPHAGCSFCSVSSTGWFEHLRTCAT